MTTNTIHHLDCTSVEAGELLSAVAPINCIVTDPPFGMEFVSNAAVTPEGKAKNEAIANDGDLGTALEVFSAAWDNVAPHMAPECEAYVFSAWHVADVWMPFLKDVCAFTGFELKMQLIWDKGYPGKGDLVGNWGCGYEIIFYLKRGRRPVHHRRSGILHYDKVPAGKNIHPTEKPVALMEQLILMSTNPGDTVCDLFSGSGATSVAAQRNGRNSIAFDTHPRYVKDSRARLEQIGFPV